MREILFRGKREDNGEWAVGDLLVNDIEGKAAIRDRSTCGVTPVIPRTVGEYTGLKDQNAKKIFEGDIVRHRDEFWRTPMQSVVEYCVDKWNYPAFDLKDNDYEEANGLQLAHERDIELEVIGNIYDNPEMLED